MSHAPSRMAEPTARPTVTAFSGFPGSPPGGAAETARTHPDRARAMSLLAGQDRLQF